MKLSLFTGSLGSVKFERSIVCAKTGRTVKRFPAQSNLIFDQGLDNLATRKWTEIFNYFVLGTGTTPTRRDSGAITFSRAGNVVTADGSFFEAGDVGRLLKFDTGEEMYVTSYTSGTSVQVNTSGTLAASEGTIYYVNRVALGAEVKRTDTKTADTGDHGFSYNGTTGVLSTWKTQIFSAETGTVTYREIGWSHAGTGSNNLSGAALLAGGGDVLVAEQQYKVKLQLDRVISPRIARALSASDVVDAWTGTAEEVIESMMFSVWGTNGNAGPAASGGDSLEPSSGNAVCLSENARALIPIATATQNESENIFGPWKTLTFGAYVAGNFFREGAASFSSVEGNSTAIRAVNCSNGSWAGLRARFSAAQAKTSSQKLTLRFRKSWGRVLTN